MMSTFELLIGLLVVFISHEVKTSSSSQVLTVNISANERVDITIPCGGRDPPYTYTKSGSSVVAENVTEYYTAIHQGSSNNGEGYCCYATGGTACYQLNITYPPYIDHRQFTGMPPSAVLGEPYDMECPYESNPPAQYEWIRVPSCGSVAEPLTWPPNTILFNNTNNKTLRLDGVLPVHYGYYNCCATNAFGSGWFCFWRKVDVCSQVESSPPDVEIENHHPIITVKLHTRFEQNCTIRSIGERGTIEWKHNHSIIGPSNSTEIIKSSYDREMCGYTSRLIIHNFTTANEGYYTCNATHESPRSENTFNSDTVYVLIDVVPSSESVCSWYDGRPPDVEIQNRSQNITVGQNKMVQMHCIIRNIGRDGKAEWKFNGSSIIPCIQCSIQVTTSGYDDKICGFVSTILITKLVVINQGIYTCSARQNNTKLYSSDSIHIFTNTTTTDIPTLTSIIVHNQHQEGSIIPLSAGFGGMVLVLVIIIFVLSVILIKYRKSILSQKIDTRHYTKPPTDQVKFKFDLLPIYPECDQDFVEKNFLTPLDKNGYLVLNHHLNFIPGNVISDNILTAVRESRYIMPIITENFLKSKYCIYELEQSVLRMIKSKSTCIIPVTADIKLLPECLKVLVTSVILEDNCTNYSTHVDRIIKTVGSPMYSKKASS